MKAEIGHLERLWDEARCLHYWQITVFVNEVPDCKLGECEIKIIQGVKK